MISLNVGSYYYLIETAYYSCKRENFEKVFYSETTFSLNIGLSLLNDYLAKLNNRPHI